MIRRAGPTSLQVITWMRGRKEPPRGNQESVPAPMVVSGNSTSLQTNNALKVRDGIIKDILGGTVTEAAIRDCGTTGLPK
jgi:hypothetical protein